MFTHCSLLCSAIYCSLLSLALVNVFVCCFSFVGFLCTHTRSPLTWTAKFLSKLCGAKWFGSSSRREQIPSNLSWKWWCVGTVFILWPPRSTRTRNTHFVFILFSVFVFFFLSIFFVLGCPSCTNQAANVNVSIKFYVRRTHRRLSACVCVCWCFHSGSHGLHRLHCVREWKNRCSNEHERTHLIFRTRKSTNTATKYLFRWTQVGLQKQHANRTRNTVTMTYYSFHTLRSDHTPNAVLFTIVYMPFVIQLLYFRRFILIEESIPRCRNCTTSFLIRSLSKKHYRSCARTLQHWLYRRCFVMGPRLAAQHEFRFLL